MDNMNNNKINALNMVIIVFCDPDGSPENCVFHDIPFYLFTTTFYFVGNNHGYFTNKLFKYTSRKDV